MLSSLKISQKLSLLVGVAIIAFVISQGLSIVTERSNSERLNQVRDRLYPTLELTTVNLGQLQLMEQQINGSVATGDDQQLEDTQEFRHTIVANLREISSLNPELAGKSKALGQSLERYYAEATRIATAIIEGTADFSRIGDEASENAARLEKLRADLNDMRLQTRSRFQDAITETVEASSNSTSLAISILIVALAVLTGLSLVIGKSIGNSLRQIIKSLENMASGEGDLTSRIHYQGKDELRELVDQFNLFVEKLHKSFATIRDDVSRLNSVTDHLTSTSQTNLERISNQAQAISSTRNSVDELVRSVEEVAGFASSASDQTQDAATFAQS
ncbi:MAG TPA: HAMP domain-containing protein, partial [Marinobacter sp.]